MPNDDLARAKGEAMRRVRRAASLPALFELLEDLLSDLALQLDRAGELIKGELDVDEDTDPPDTEHSEGEDNP